MTALIMRAGHSQTARDILFASMFALWAVLLGVVPVLAIYGFSGG
jgi:hypothetical protein